MQNLKESPRPVQEEHMNFLIYNQEIEEIMSFFPRHFSPDPNVREEQVFDVISKIKETLTTLEQKKRGTSFIFEKIKSLVFQNPYYDVSLRFEAFYLEYYQKGALEENKISRFYPNDQIPSLRAIAKYLSSNDPKEPSPIPFILSFSKEVLQSILAEAYSLNDGKIPNLERLLCWYPELLQINMETKQCIMMDSGPLPLDWRFFIAIMAISCYGCNYYFYRLGQHFMRYGGDKRWLEEGLQAVPQKLRNLQELNSLIAYKPWALYQSNCIKGKDQWNIPELLHAIVIMSYYHSWACFIFANGIKLEDNMGFFSETEGKYIKKRSFDDKNSFPTFNDTKNEDIITLLRKLEKESESQTNETFGLFEMDPLSSFEEISIPDEEFLIEAENENEEEICDIAFTQFISKDIKTIEEFNLQKYRILHSHVQIINEFNFSTHGSLILSDFLPDIAQKIFQEFTTLTKMTKRTFLDAENVNTDPLRISIWYFTHNIYGYYHDHFDYKQVKKLMTKELKQFIKNIVLKPFDINFQNFSNLKIKFFPWEKCHITLLAIAAKFEMELTYGLECLNNILTERYN